MVRGAHGIFFLLALSSGLMAAKLPPLPSWNDADLLKLKSGDIIVGKALLTKGGEREKDAPPPAEVVIEAVEEKPSLVVDQKLDTRSEITGVHLERYFGQLPTSSLVDPQRLLSMQERADLEYALRMHREESELDIFVYLFDELQQVPEEYAPQEVYDSVFGGNEKPLVVVYYYLGNPSRSKFLLAGGAASDVPEWQVHELLWNAAHKAREKSDSFDQLDDFVGQLSMRLFWVEEIMSEMLLVEAPVQEVVPDEKADRRKEELLGFWETYVEQYLKKTLMGAGLVLALLGLWLRFVLKRKYAFPEEASSSRLGGSVGGGCGGVLHYKNAQVPPSMQKKQFEQDFF